MERRLLSGNEAIGRGAIEAGISFAASYPGTPATEILEYIARHFDGEAEWAVNEKIAFETAVGASYAGKRAICSMKQVGVNVAADPLMTSAYLGIKGGLVLVAADDPGGYSSQNEQDSRCYAKFAKIPCLEPSDSQEAKDMTVLAFDLSEEMELPVMLRSVTRVSHGATAVETGLPRQQNGLSLEKNPERLLAIPSNVLRFHKTLNEKQERLKDWSVRSGLNRMSRNGQRKGIVACGIAYAYALEYGEEFAVLKVGSYPFHERMVVDFVGGLEEIWVLEEGEPLVEELVRRHSPHVRGRMTGEIRGEGELGPDVLARYVGWRGEGDGGIEPPPVQLPMRPPVLCAGCAHREFYKALKAANPVFTTGDIGCYTLGAAPPLRAMDTCMCMGASISKAEGISKQGVRRVAAVIGDSTFLHSGIPALINAVYNKADIMVVIMDNSCTAMTGHQPTPLVGITAKNEEGGKVSLEDLCRACGAGSVEVVNPYDMKATTRILEEKLDSQGVHVVISRAPCVFLLKQQKKR